MLWLIAQLSVTLPAILSGFLPTDPARRRLFMLGAFFAIGGVGGQPRVVLSGPGAVIHVFHDFSLTSFFSFDLHFAPRVSKGKVVKPVKAVLLL